MSTKTFLNLAVALVMLLANGAWLSGLSLAADETSSTKRYSDPTVSPKASLTPKQFQQWIEALGSDHFATREKASKALFSAGAGSLKYLVPAVEDKDLEVASRAASVIVLLARSKQLPEETTIAAIAALEEIATGKTSSARTAKRALQDIMPLRLVVRSERTKWKPEEAVSMTMELKNVSRRDQNIVIWYCSFYENFGTDNEQVTQHSWECFKNYRQHIKLSPGQSITKKMNMMVKKKTPVGPLTFRIGFTSDGSKEVVWSKPVAITVVR